MRLLVFCLVLFWSGPVWGGGYWISEEQLTALELSLNQQIKALSEVRQELSTYSTRLSESELKLSMSEKELTLAQEDLEKSRKDLKEALTSLEQSEISGWIKLGAGVLAGFGLGYILFQLF